MTRCLECGYQVENDANYCSNCGCRLNGSVLTFETTCEEDDCDGTTKSSPSLAAELGSILLSLLLLDD